MCVCVCVCDMLQMPECLFSDGKVVHAERKATVDNRDTESPTLVLYKLNALSNSYDSLLHSNL